jgi:hypothetical protein
LPSEIRYWRRCRYASRTNEDRIDGDAHDILDAIGNFQLQQIVGSRVYVADVRKKVRNAVLHRLRQCPYIRLSDRLQGVLVDLVIEREDGTIERFQWITPGRRLYRRTACEYQCCRHCHPCGAYRCRYCFAHFAGTLA